MSAPNRAMNTSLSLALVALMAALMGGGPLAAAESDDQTVTGASAVEPPNAKAGKYHEVLVRRPRPDYLFDRFVDAWLVDGTQDELESFLRGRTSADATAADLLLLAFFYSKAGRDVEAQQTFARAAEMAPDHPAVFYHQAKVAARLLDVETAIASLERAGTLAHEQETSDALVTDIASLHGRLLIQSGSVEEALGVWQELLQTRPQDEGLREDLVELLVDQGQFDQALEASERLIAVTDDPYQKVMHTLRQGDIHLRAGKRDQAVTVYVAALENVGQDTWLEREVLDQLERCYRREDDLAGLQERYEHLVTDQPQRIALQRRQAALLVEQGDLDAATSAFEALVAAAPRSREIRTAFIDALVQAEAWDQALAHQEELCALFERDAELQIQRAELAHQAGKTEIVTAALDRFVALAVPSTRPHLRAAKVLERLGMSEAAEEAFLTARTAHPEDEAVAEAYSAFLFDQDRADEALALIRSRAEDAGLVQLLRLVRRVEARAHYQEAGELLASREADFAQEADYQQARALNARRREEPAVGLHWARQLLRTVEDDAEVLAAVDLVVDLARAAEQIESLTEEVQENDDLVSRCLLAALFELRDDPVAADRVMGQMASEPLAWRFQVDVLRQRQDWAGAIQVQRRLMQEDEDSTASLRTLIGLLRRADQIDEALEVVEQWKQRTPGSEQPWLMESRLEALQGDEEQSLTVLRHAARRFADNQNVRAQLAAALTTAGHYGEAKRHYWTLYEDAEDLADKLRWAGSLADVAAHDGSVEDLLQTFRERHRANRNSIEPLLAIADIHRREYDYEARRRALLEAVRLRPKDVDLLHRLAQVELQEQDFERALETLSRAEDFDPTDRTRREIAKVHLAMGDLETGYRLIQEIAGPDGVPVADIEALAQSMAGQLEWQRAADFLQEPLAKHPDAHRLHHLRIVCLLQANRPEAAAEAAITALRLPLPQATQSQQQNQQIQLWVDLMNDLVPQDTISLMATLWQGHQALQFRQQQQGYGGFRQQHQQHIPLPSTPDEIAAYRRLLVRPIYEDLKVARDDEAADEFLRRAQRVSVPFLQELVWMPGPYDMHNYNWSHLLSQHPENRVLHAAVVMNQVWNGHLERSVATRVETMFADERPWLGLVSVLHDSEADLPGDAGTRLRRYLDQLDPDNIMVGMSVVSALQKRDEPLEEEQQQHLLQSVVIPLITNDDASQMNAWIRAQGFALLTEAGTVEQVVAVLNEIMRSSESGSTPVAWFSFGGRQDGLLATLPYPPPLPHLKSVTSIMQMIERMNDRGVQDLQLAEHLEAIEDPLLRAWLAAHVEQPVVVEEAIAAGLAEEAPAIDTYLLAAAHAAEQEEYARAVAMLHRGTNLAMSRATRKQLDGALVAYAQLSTDSESRSLGARAARRLQASVHTPDETTELIAAMADLGLEQEADALDARQQALQTVQSTSSGRSHQDLSDRIEEFAQEGKETLAVREAVRALRSWAAGQLRGQQGGIHAYELRQVREKLDEHELVMQVLERLDPGDSPNRMRRLQYARVAQELGRTDLAMPIYRAVLAENPDDGTIKILVALGLMGAKPDEAVAVIEDLDPRHEPLFAAQLTQWIENKHQVTSEMITGPMRLAQGWIASLPADHGFDLQWMPRFIDVTITSRNVDDDWAPHLYHAHDRDPEHLPQEFMEFRAQWHDDICRRLISEPAIAPAIATRALYRARQTDGDVAAALQAGRQALLRYEPAPQRHSQHWTSLGNDMAARWQPIEHAVFEQAFRAGADSLSAWVERLQADSNFPSNRIERLAVLYRGTDEEFVAAIGEVDFGSQTLVLSQQPYTLNNGVIVVQCWQLRGAPGDIGERLIDAALGTYRRRGHWQMDPGLVAYFRICAEEGLHDAIPRDLERLATELLAPPDERRAFVAEHYDPNSYSHNSPNARIRMWIRGMKELMTVPRLYGHAAGMVVRAGITDALDHGVQSTFESWLESDDRTVVRETLAGLRHAPLADSVTGFDPMTVEYGSQTTVFALLAGKLRSDQALRAIAREAWADSSTAGTLPFGHRLLMALATEASNQDLTQILAEYEQAFRVLPDHRSDAILATIDSLGLDLTFAPQSFATWVAEERRRARSAALEAFLAAESPGDLDLRVWDLKERSVELLAQVGADRVEECLTLLRQVRRLAASPSNSGSTTRDRSLLSEILDEWLEDGRSEAVMRVVARALSEDLCALSDHVHYELRKGLRQTVSQRGRSVQGLQELHAEWQGAIDRDAALVLTSAFYGTLDLLPEDQRRQLLDWCDQRSDGLALAIGIALRARMLNEEAQPELRDQLRQQVVPVLADDSLSANARMQVALTICAPNMRYGADFADGVISRVYPAVILACLDTRNMHDEDIGTLGSRLLKQSPEVIAEHAAAILEAEHGFAESLEQQQSGWMLKRDDDNEKTRQQFMLHAALVADDRAAIRRHVRGMEAGGSISSWVLLLRAGHVDTVAEQFRTHWQSPQWLNDNTTYDRRIHDALPELVGALLDPGTALLAEAVFKALPGSITDDDGKSLDREQRLQAVADRLSDTSFTAEGQRERVLAVLGIEPDVLADHAGQFAAITDSPSLYAAVFEAPPAQFDRRYSLLWALARMEIGNDRPAQLTRLFDEIRLQKRSALKAHEDRLSKLFHLVERQLRDGVWMRWDRTEARAWCPVLRSATLLPDDIGERGERARFGGWCVAVHHLAGKADQLRSWFDGIDVDARKRAREQMAWNRVWEPLAELLVGNVADSPSALAGDRRRLVVAMLTDPLAKNDGNGHAEYFDDLVEHGLLVADELKNDGPVIAEAIPNHGHSWASLARELAKAGHADAAISHWERAIAADHLSVRWGFELIETAIEARLAERAQHAIDAQSQRSLDDGEPQRLQTLRNRLAELDASEDSASMSAPATADADSDSQSMQTTTEVVIP